MNIFILVGAALMAFGFMQETVLKKPEPPKQEPPKPIFKVTDPPPVDLTKKDDGQAPTT